MKSISEKKANLASSMPFSIGAVFLVFYAIIFTVSPLNGEDFALTRDFQGSDIFTRLAWVVQRSYQQIVGWNARLGEQLAIFWLSMPKFFFTIFSIFSYLAFCFLAVSIISVNARIEKTYIALMLVFIMWPRLELFFWGTVNAGYLQPLVICLACLYAYSSGESVGRLFRSNYFYLIISLLGFLAGLSFENIPLVVVIYMSMALLVYGANYVSIKTIAPILSVSAGWLLLITAPSTVHRVNYYKGIYGNPEYSYQYFYHRAIDVIELFFKSSSILIATTVLLSLYLHRNNSNRKQLLLNILVIVLVVVSVIPAPYTEPRAFSLAWAIMIGICANAIYEIAINVSYKWVYILVTVCGLFFAIKTASLYYDYSDRLSERHYYIKKMSSTLACDSGIVIHVNKKSYPERYIKNRDIWYKKASKHLGKYYGCRIIVES